LVLAVLGSGCGERFQIGDIVDEHDEAQTGSAPWNVPVLADGPEDADVRVEGRQGGPVGDVDGDGYDDWMSGSHLAYGRPRPADGVLTVPVDEGPTLLLHDGTELLGTIIKGAGDVNGDGYADLLLSTYVDTQHSYDFERGEYAADLAEGDAAVARRWGAQRAYLWYGGPERTPGEHELGEAAVAFADRDDLVGRFQAELTMRFSPDDALYNALQTLTLVPLGDIDADGHADLALTATFAWDAAREEKGDGITQVTTRQRRESFSYIYYGRNQRLTIGATPEPDVRLVGVSAMSAIGDVDGDGYGDMQAIASDGLHLLPGGPQRLSGEPSLTDAGVAVPLAVPAVLPFGSPAIGDIDQDGFDDLVVFAASDSESRNYIIYGSPQLFERPLDSSAASAVFSLLGPLAIVTNLGDWNGDGAADLLFIHARVLSEVLYGPEARYAGAEVRLIPGSSERYSGRRDFSVFRPNASGAEPFVVGAGPAGDVDGDGYADVFFSTVESANERSSYLKYGGPLTAESPIR